MKPTEAAAEDPVEEEMTNGHRAATAARSPLRDSLSAAADLLEDRAARHAPGLTASRDDARRTMGGQACG